MSIRAHTAKIAGAAIVFMALAFAFMAVGASAERVPPPPPQEQPRLPAPPDDPTSQPRDEEKLGPCHCEDLGVRLSQNSHSLDRQGNHAWGFRLSWLLACSKGQGGCQGKISIGKSSRGTLSGPFKSKLKPIACKGPCGGGNDGYLDLTLRFRSTGTPFVATFTITVECEETTTTLPITLKFNGRGWFDRGNSDLNGDGQRDGK